MDSELSRRALDLSRRAEKYAAPVNSGFLSPAEQAELRAFCARERRRDRAARRFVLRIRRQYGRFHRYGEKITEKCRLTRHFHFFDKIFFAKRDRIRFFR